MPDSDIDILKKMLTEQILVKLEDSYGKKRVTLSETDYAVLIVGIPDEAVVIKPDIFPPPKAVFCGSKGECKRADCVIVVNTDKRKVILYIEMKAQSNTSKASEIIQQFKGAQCFVSYCQAIGKVFWEQENFLEGYECRFVKIVSKNQSINKQSSRPKSEVHDRPDRMLMIKNINRLQFNQLVGKFSRY